MSDTTPPPSLSELKKVVSISMCCSFWKIQREFPPSPPRLPELNCQYWHPPLKDQLRCLEGLSRTKISRLSSSTSSTDSNPFPYCWAMGCSWEETRKGKSKADHWAHLMKTSPVCVVGWRIHWLETVTGRAWNHSQCQVMCLPVADASPHLGTICPFHVKQLWDEIDRWLLENVRWYAPNPVLCTYRLSRVPELTIYAYVLSLQVTTRMGRKLVSLCILENISIFASL